MASRIPCRVVNAGEIVHESNEWAVPISVGEILLVFGHGLLREARVINATPTRVRVAYVTPSSPNAIKRPWNHRPDLSPYRGQHTVYRYGEHPQGLTYGMTFVVHRRDNRHVLMDIETGKEAR